MSFLSGLAKVAGGAGGFLLGGPAGAAAGYGLASAVTGGGGGGKTATPSTNALNTATQAAGANSATDRNTYLDTLKNGQSALNMSIDSAVSSAMPQLKQQLQTAQESGVRRGISTGDLGTSNEGDIYSTFQRNIANSAGQQAMNLFNTTAGAEGNLYNSDQNNYLSLLRGNQDVETAQQNAKKAKQSSLFGGLGALVGNQLGGTTGAAIGSAIGSGIGG